MAPADGRKGSQSGASADNQATALPALVESVPAAAGEVDVPEGALQFGLAKKPGGVLASRTLMLPELRQLLAACPGDSTFSHYRQAILQDNVLAKQTSATRSETLWRLTELYALDAQVLLFRVLRELWPEDTTSQPLLACLCASAREPVFRATGRVVLDLALGASLVPEMLAKATAAAFPGYYNATTLGNISRNAAAAWKQSGHLQGRLKKTRAQAVCRPVALSYALLLGWLCGARGDYLFRTLWAELLDAPIHQLREQAVEASRLGWVDYRHAGGVVEISFKHLLRSEPGVAS